MDETWNHSMVEGIIPNHVTQAWNQFMVERIDPNHVTEP